MLVLISAISALGQSPRTHMAGIFKEGVNLESDERKDIRSNDNIVFADTAVADLDMDGHPDKVSVDGGLHILFWTGDSSSRRVDLSNDNGKIALYDVNDDGITDIVQTAGLIGGLQIYENTSMPLLIPQMIPINEDHAAYLTYDNFNDSLGITYEPSISTPKIGFTANDNGVLLTPAPNWHGTATLAVSYGTATYRDTAHYPILVLAVNDAPVVSDPGDTLILNEDGFIPIYKDSLLSLASDPDTGDVLSVYPIGDRREVSATDSMFTYRPAGDWFGEDSLDFVVTDGELNDTLTLRLRVLPVNDAPKWTPIAAIEFPEDEYAQRPLSLFADHASDVETPDSLLRFYAYSGEHVVISTEGSAITLMGDKDWFGTDRVLLVVSDGEKRDSLYWTVNITPVNDAPELAALPDTLFMEDQTIYIGKSQLEKYASDIETPTNKLKWQVKRFGKIRAFYNGVRIRCTASPDWYGTDSLELTVSDGELTASRIWRIHVLPVNDPPVWLTRHLGRSFLEDDTLHILKRDLYKYVGDPETAAQDLIWHLKPNGPVTINESEKDYSIYAEPNWFGNVPMKIIVSDGEYSDSVSYPLRVISVNDKPTMKDLPPEKWNEDDTLSIDKSFLRSLAQDVETKKMDLMWAFINDTHLKVKDRKNAITLVPDRDWNGDARIGVIVYDGGLRDTGYMDITIKPVNDAPRWKAFPDTSITEDKNMVLPMDYIRSFVYDPDQGDEIKISYEAGDNFYVEEKEDTLIIWPYEDWYGKENIEFTATDGKKSVSKNWTIPVKAVNDAPYFTMGLPDSLSFRANSSDTLIFEDIVYDVDNDLKDLTWDITPGRYVRYIINDNINGAKKDKDKKAGVIFYTENYKSGEDAVTIRVSDGHDQIVFYLPIYVKEVDRFLMANPEKLELLPNTPNPFTEYTDIRYSLPVPANVSIKIYNLLGKEMKTLASGHHAAQNYSVRWWGETDSGMPAPSGVYLCRMTAVVDGEPAVMMQKMMLVR
jgi:hypothetical protein